MLKNGVKIAVLLVCTLVMSFCIGYLLMDGASKQPSDSKNAEIPFNETVIAKTGEHKGEDLIDKNTIVKKTIRYTRGEEYKDTKIEAPLDDMIGMNEEKTKNYFLEKGFSLLKFTEDEIEIIGEEKNTWPPRHYVILADSGNKVSTYKVDDTGNLKFIETLEIEFESLPIEVKNMLHKGKVFKTVDELDTYVAETLES